MLPESKFNANMDCMSRFIQPYSAADSLCFADFDSSLRVFCSVARMAIAADKMPTTQFKVSEAAGNNLVIDVTADAVVKAENNMIGMLSHLLQMS